MLHSDKDVTSASFLLTLSNALLQTGLFPLSFSSCLLPGLWVYRRHLGDAARAGPSLAAGEFSQSGIFGRSPRQYWGTHQIVLCSSLTNNRCNVTTKGWDFCSWGCDWLDLLPYFSWSRTSVTRIHKSLESSITTLINRDINLSVSPVTQPCLKRPMAQTVFW